MKAGLLALGLLGVVVPACSCGDDDGGGSTPDAAWPDAGFIAGPTDDAGVPAHWLVSCGAEEVADAGPECDAGPEFDAGPAFDAGAPPGFDDPCCDPDGVCPSGLECI